VQAASRQKVLMSCTVYSLFVLHFCQSAIAAGKEEEMCGASEPNDIMACLAAMSTSKENQDQLRKLNSGLDEKVDSIDGWTSFSESSVPQVMLNIGYSFATQAV
jgi:hypothetical protein